jgi:hypothetical protein
MKKHLWVLGLLLTLQTPSFAMGWFQPAPETFSRLESLEYFLRWDYTDFDQRYSWRARLLSKIPDLLLPAAHAELPPQYQKAFSLRIIPQHKLQRLRIEYHEQMVTNDRTHKAQRFESNTQAYARLESLLSKPLSCTQGAEPGWVGPAPELLRVSYKQKASRPEDLIFADPTGKGSAGPSEEEYKRNTRRYLCNEALRQWLRQQIQTALKTT